MTTENAQLIFVTLYPA